MLALLAFALFTFRITRSGLSGDEAYGASLAIRGLDAVLDVTRTGEPHPPLYYALLSLWIPLAGDSEFALRFLSVAAGTALIPLIYHLGRLTVRGPAAIFAAAWTAVHPYHVWYAQEARMYLPFALFSTLSMVLFIHLQSRPRRTLAIAYT
ncbi:MAG TPA: glycosyltransferase family 39 protein, partial [Bacillota bacterium]